MKWERLSGSRESFGVLEPPGRCGYTGAFLRITRVGGDMWHAHVRWDVEVATSQTLRSRRRAKQWCLDQWRIFEVAEALGANDLGDGY